MNKLTIEVENNIVTILVDGQKIGLVQDFLLHAGSLSGSFGRIVFKTVGAKEFDEMVDKYAAMIHKAAPWLQVEALTPGGEPPG
jgi:hypothetical protein